MEFVIILIANTFCFVIMEISQQIVCRMGLGNFCIQFYPQKAPVNKERNSKVEYIESHTRKTMPESPCKTLFYVY